MDNANTELVYPRLIRRVRAFLIDFVLLVIMVYGWMISLQFLAELHLLLKITALIIPIIVLEPALVAFTGGTPGHHIMGLRIRDASRDVRIGMLRAAARALIRTLLGWLSFIFVLVTKRHQALHDYFTSTVVVLSRPDTQPAHDKFAARTEDHAHFLYPSKSRRIFVILLYVFLSYIIFSVLVRTLVSSGCLTTDDCGPLENIVANILVTTWLLCVGAIVVLGWRALLYGCRRSATP